MADKANTARDYDVAIIGAGTAGLAALREVRKQTDNFVIINSGPYGTTCARVGCMPSKALIEAANAFERRNALEAFGVHGAEALRADIAAVLSRVRELRDEFVRGLRATTDGLGERSIAGAARFVEPDVLEVNGEICRARNIIIATGSKPVMPREWTMLGERVLTSDTIFEQRTLPARMAVVGMGVVGAEIAQALARLGIEVTGFGAGMRVAGISDPVVNAAASKLLAAEFELVCGERAHLRSEGEGVRVTAAGHSIVVEKVLAALGRRANLEGLGLERIGVALDEHGMPPYARNTMRIADLPIYIAGDVSEGIQVLHEASDEGYIAGQNAGRSEPICYSRRVPLAIVFTDPNVVSVGARFESLIADDIHIGMVDFSRQGRARMAQENHGVLRVYAAKSTGRLLGAELCAPRGENLAHLLALAIQQEMTVQQMLRLPFYHPVFEEGLRMALRDVVRQLGPIAPSDLANCDPVQRLTS